MVQPIHDTDDPNKKYHSQYQLNSKTFPVWKKFWEKLFHGHYDLSHDDVCKMTDTFVNFISQQMSSVLNRALKIQKANDKAMESGDSPDYSGI